MADVKITALPAASSPIASDTLIPVVTDPSGTPVTQKATVTTLSASMASPTKVSSAWKMVLDDGSLFQNNAAVFQGNPDSGMVSYIALNAASSKWHVALADQQTAELTNAQFFLVKSQRIRSGAGNGLLEFGPSGTNTGDFDIGNGLLNMFYQASDGVVTLNRDGDSELKAAGSSGANNARPMLIHGGDAGGSGTGGNLRLRGGTSASGTPGQVVLTESFTPASATAPGEAGTVAWDTDYVYVCVATDTWKRSALSTWP